MKIRIKNTSASEQFTGLAYATIGFIGFILSKFDSFILQILPRCTFQQITGLPCPSCGATRAGIFLGNFELLNSILENPLYFILYIALFLYGTNSFIGAVFGKNIHIQFQKLSRKIIYFIIITAIGANWLYLIVQSIRK
jgi:hypothetical protein